MMIVEPVGNYAIRIVWSDGHSTGIYSFEHFRQDLPLRGVQKRAVLRTPGRRGAEMKSVLSGPRSAAAEAWGTHESRRGFSATAQGRTGCARRAEDLVAQPRSRSACSRSGSAEPIAKSATSITARRPRGSNFWCWDTNRWAKWWKPVPGCTHVPAGDLVTPMVRHACPHADCAACRAGRQDFCYTGDFQRARHQTGARLHDGFRGG